MFDAEYTSLRFLLGHLFEERFLWQDKPDDPDSARKILRPTSLKVCPPNYFMNQAFFKYYLFPYRHITGLYAIECRTFNSSIISQGSPEFMIVYTNDRIAESERVTENPISGNLLQRGDRATPGASDNVVPYAPGYLDSYKFNELPYSLSQHIGDPKPPTFFPNEGILSLHCEGSREIISGFAFVAQRDGGIQDLFPRCTKVP